MMYDVGAQYLETQGTGLFSDRNILIPVLILYVINNPHMSEKFVCHSYHNNIKPPLPNIRYTDHS